MNLVNYTAERDAHGILTIRDVPIFVECTRGDVAFDPEWIRVAVLKAKQAEAEGYLPPLHVRHHEDGPSELVRAAGFFRITGTRVIIFKGASKLAVIADLVITDPSVGQEVLSKRLPYRSVEIFDVAKPAIDSLALLDHEAPYLELPMLMVGTVSETGTELSPVGVASATFSNPWRKKVAPSSEGLVACFRRGSTAHLLYQDTDMTNKRAKFEADPKKDGESKDGEKMQEGPALDVGAVVKAIESGSISVADMDAILAAIAAQKGAAVEVESEEKPAMEKDGYASAPVPGAAMTAIPEEMTNEMARLRGEVEAAKARLNERDALDRRNEDVRVAMQRLDGRPLGSDLNSKLEKFHADHGPQAFAAYVDGLVTTFASLAGSGDRALAAFSAQAPKASDIAMKYAAEGSEAVGAATRFSTEWKELNNRGMVRMSEDRYVAVNMNRAGFNQTKN